MIVVLVLSMALPLLLAMLLAAAFLLGRHWQRRHVYASELSQVTKQHMRLFQGGQLNEQLVETTKRQIQEQLERGESRAVEDGLRPGTQFVIQVRALAEIGTEEAGRILERQLERRLTEDPLEQSWYWIDLANGLRALHRDESLPRLLTCADAAGELPLAHIIAAETVCFLGFVGYLNELDTPLGRAALRVLHRALEGLRYGVQPQLLVEGRLGEVIERLWDEHGERAHPLLARVLVEARRLAHRAAHLKRLLADDAGERDELDWQLGRLEALEPAIADYLAEVPAQLAEQLDQAEGTERCDLLVALNDLRADVGTHILRQLARPDFAQHERAVEVLTWSRDPKVGRFLRAWVEREGVLRRNRPGRRHSEPPVRPSLPAVFPYRAILRALRNQPAVETESLLVAAAGDWDPTFRAAAVSSLGWWEPLQRDAVLDALHATRTDSNSDVRQPARAALARLGERYALQWFRRALASDDPQHLFETLQIIAGESLTLLWPDVDRLVDSPEVDIAYLASETLERLSEATFDRS